MRDRIVEVIVTLDDEQLRFGSGLLIGGQVVLTAAHVVVGARAVVVRTSDKRELPAVLDPAWVGDPGRCDLALLEVTELAAGFDFLPIALIDRRSSSTALVENCTSIGFPVFAEELDEHGRSVRKAKQVGGWIAPLSRLDDGLLSLEVTATPRELPAAGTTLDDSPWSGMSGAAVLAGDRLVGVVSEHSTRRGPSDITVTPLDFLSDPDRITGDWWERLGVTDPSALPKLPSPAGALDTGPQEQRKRRVRYSPAGGGHVDRYFAGRETELSRLDAALADQEQVVVTQVVAGLGGVGKTQLAACYVRDHADEFDIVAWIRAETSPIPDLATLAAELRLDTASEGATSEERAEQAVRWLSACDERWLLVFDNVATESSVRPWLPATGRGRVLITSRNRHLDTLGPLIPIGVFDDETGADYLLQRAGRNDRDAALALSHALGGLPLALAHAGAYCQAGVSFAEYQAMLDGLPARELFEQDPEAFAIKTVATTWQVSIEAAVKRAPLAEQVLAVAAYLAPDAIPTALFDVLLGDNTNIAERKQLQDARAALHGLSLVELSDTTLDVHRLLQKVVRDDAEAKGNSGPQETALAALGQALPKDPELPAWWPQYEVLLPHVMTISETTAAERYPGQVVALLHFGCSFLLRADPGRRSLDVAQRQLAVSERLLSPDHPNTLTARANLAFSYWLAGRTQEAIELEERVLADRERLLGSDHPATLTTRNNLASSYQSAGRTREAIDLKERVLADRERLLGSDHPDTLTTRGNLAISYQAAGRIQEAIDLFEHVLADHKRLLGPDHPNTHIVARALEKLRGDESTRR
jgi:tetratricopeptide (TPR) repeat protein